MRSDDLRMAVKRSSPTHLRTNLTIESHGVHCREGRRVRCEFCNDWLRPVRRGRTVFFRRETNRRCIGVRQPRGVGWRPRRQPRSS